jgi:signal transduction histidine kinase
MNNTDNLDKLLLRSSFFDQSETQFLLLDKRFNIIDANGAALCAYKLSKYEMIGKNIQDLIPDIKNKGRLEIYEEVMRAGNPVTLDEIKTLENDGTTYHRIKAFKVEDGLGLCTINISDLKNAVEELDDFVNKSSQDMRSPIATILGLASIAKNSTADSESTYNYLNMIKTEALKLDNTLQKLIKISRIQQGEKVLSLIDFKSMIQNVIHSLAFVEGYENVNFKLNLHNTRIFYSEMGVLATILQNIFNNAIKYRKTELQESTVEIKVIDDGDGIVLSIADNGIGIATDDLQNIFKMFVRATNQAQGAGLGLYTVKHYIHSLGGTIMVNSKLNVGTTFHIFLPNMK